MLPAAAAVAAVVRVTACVYPHVLIFQRSVIFFPYTSI